MQILYAVRSARYALETFAGKISKVSLAFFASLIVAGPVYAQCVSITSYNGNGNNSSALAAAFAALPTYGGCISFPAGKYQFNTSVSLSLVGSISSLTLVGAGADSTILYFPSTSGITVNTNSDTQSVHVRDVTFSTGTAGGQTALTVTNAQPQVGALYGSDIFRTTFRGDDGGALNEYWGTGVDILGQSNVNFDSVNFFGNGTGTGGVGISLSGNKNAKGVWYYGLVYNIAKCGFLWTNVGIEIVTYVQGVAVTQSNFTNGVNSGIWAQPNGYGLNELAVTGGNQFAVGGPNDTSPGNDIIIQQPINNLIVSGNLFFVPPGGSGIFLDSTPATGGYGSITNNIFESGQGGIGPYGIYVETSNPNTVVTGNVFEDLTTGIDLVGTSGWNVQANTYLAVGTHVAAIGSNSVGVATP